MSDLAGAGPAAPIPDNDRQRLVAQAIKEWVNQLVDLSGRNRLLFYRTLTRGTMELTEADELPLGRLLDGRRVTLSDLYPPMPDKPNRLDDARKRARVIHAKAVEHFEERGIETLYLGVGLAAWTTTSTAAKPAAPVLVRPLVLDSKGASHADFDVALQGDWDINATLVHYLANEFTTKIDTAALLDQFTSDNESGDFDPSVVFAGVQNAASNVPDFTIDYRLVVGTFAYTKLPMVRDLETSVEVLTEHDIIAAIAGDASARATLRESRSDITESEPDRTPPQDEYLILDADASQSYAINAAVGGEPLVIQGPPGTGKSQTIANLIATYVARGKRVLFVAEKRAAIDAVTKRLDGVGLGRLVMDLHGGVTSRRRFAEDLQHTLTTLGQVPTRSQTDLEHRLDSSRKALVDYVTALHQPRQPWGLSLDELVQRLLATGRGNRPPAVMLPPRDVAALDDSSLREARELLEEWASLIAPILADASPWKDAKIETEDDARAAMEIVAALAGGQVNDVRAQLDRVLAETGLPTPGTVSEWRITLDLLAGVAGTADRFGIEIYELDLDQLASDLAPGAGGAVPRATAHLVRKRYRDAKSQLRDMWRGDGKPGGRQLHDAVATARAHIEQWRTLGGHGVPRLPADLAAVSDSYQALTSQLAALGAYLVAGTLTEGRHDELSGQVQRYLQDERSLFRQPRIRHLERRLTELRLVPFLDAVRNGGLPSDGAAAAFEHSWCWAARSHVVSGDTRLSAFDGQRHRQRVADFRISDREHIHSTTHRVLRRAAEAAVAARNAQPGQDELVRAQAKRKRGHLPLRALFEKAPDVLTAIRPCWVMSPLVVSQTLPARAVFDVVIFDEASQVLPADAVPALLRAPQAIVAGDRHQLPPTTFFGTDTGDDGEEEVDDAALVTGFESILDVLGSLLRDRMLTWHYRSEDERLIAFSNVNIYDRGLTTFPGSRGEGCLTFVGIPHRFGVPTDTRSNSDEVEKVVDLMVEHARTRPDESLGVIGMGIHHADRIEAALRARIVQEADRDLNAYFDEHQEERPFVKNLERVQGDERDAIILSVGYGKQPDGRLAYRFGPLNQEGGERRLNVAVSRARRRLTLVASFGYSDMDPGRSSARGVELLRRYLKYAASEGRDLEGAEHVPALNPFEIDVKRRLTDAGLTVIPQHGVSGFRIDFAVPHPTEPGRMLLAIEADGASYHSSATARDRDRLRQQVLERLGWRFHRIWSTDWFLDPDTEVGRAVAAYEAALAEDDGDDDPAGSPALRPRPGPGGTGRPIVPHRTTLKPRGIGGGRPITEYSELQLVALAGWIASDTLLRTEAEFVEEMIQELGYRRRGARIVEAVTKAVRQVQRN